MHAKIKRYTFISKIQSINENHNPIVTSLTHSRPLLKAFLYTTLTIICFIGLFNVMKWEGVWGQLVNYSTHIKYIK